MSMQIDLKPGEVVKLGDGKITVTLLEKSGKIARIAIEAPREVKIERPQRPKQ